MTGRLPRLVGWVLAANAFALAATVALATPAADALQGSVRGFVAWCGIG